ncbi:MAG: hypothetical protein L6Q92_16885 [Phycisphaerae bacterium]|nr:hypothetical protein [Phycisphaerae bacterium]
MNRTARSMPAAASALQAMFNGTYTRWAVAGAVRRRAEGEAKVQHVMIPRLAAPPAIGSSRDWRLFNLLVERAQHLAHAGRLEIKPPPADARFGDRCLVLRCDGIDHELFCCWPENWGCVLAIRTGPPSFVRELAARLLSNGYELQRNWLQCWRPSMQPMEIVPYTVDCPDEETLFRLAGIPKVTEPWERK